MAQVKPERGLPPGGDIFHGLDVSMLSPQTQQMARSLKNKVAARAIVEELCAGRSSSPASPFASYQGR